MENPQDQNELNSLEDQGTVIESDTAQQNDGAVVSSESRRRQGFGNRVRTAVSHVNIYLLLFILILVAAGLIVFATVQRSRKETASDPTATQLLSPETLKELSDSEAKVGDPKQVLNVESNAVFSGKVLVRDSLDVAGTIRAGGALSLPGITVSGASSFDTIQANNLSISGNTNVQGQLTVQRGLTVSGGASFSGPVSAPQITVSTFQISGDLQINRHLDAGGNTPGKADGSALGIGGTSSVSGTDTAGTVSINTGGNPPAGCFITVTFSQRFNGTPHVVVTPVGSAAAGLNYYITRSTINFSICTTNPAPASQSFAFDYVAID